MPQSYQLDLSVLGVRSPPYVPGTAMSLLGGLVKVDSFDHYRTAHKLLQDSMIHSTLESASKNFVH
jgi:hypothetical protein